MPVACEAVAQLLAHALQQIWPRRDDPPTDEDPARRGSQHEHVQELPESEGDAIPDRMVRRQALRGDARTRGDRRAAPQRPSASAAPSTSVANPTGTLRWPPMRAATSVLLQPGFGVAAMRPYVLVPRRTSSGPKAPMPRAAMGPCRARQSCRTPRHLGESVRRLAGRDLHLLAHVMKAGAEDTDALGPPSSTPASSLVGQVMARGVCKAVEGEHLPSLRRRAAASSSPAGSVSAATARWASRATSRFAQRPAPSPDCKPPW